MSIMCISNRLTEKIRIFYREFRKRHPNPSVSVEDTEHELDCLFRSFPGVTHCSASPLIEIIFRLDPCATDEEIDLQLKAFRQQVINHPGRQWDSFAWLKGTGWEGKHGKLPALKKCLDVFDLYQQVGNKAEVSRRMDWFNPEDRGSSTKEISFYLQHAERLINAAGNSFTSFIDELKKPIQRKKK